MKKIRFIFGAASGGSVPVEVLYFRRGDAGHLPITVYT